MRKYNHGDRVTVRDAVGHVFASGTVVEIMREVQGRPLYMVHWDEDDHLTSHVTYENDLAKV